MFTSFLFDYKCAYFQNHSLKMHKPFDWVFVIITLITGISFIISAYNLNILGSVALLLVMFTCLGSELSYTNLMSVGRVIIPTSKCPPKSFNYCLNLSFLRTMRTNDQHQLNYFLTQWVPKVETMLCENFTDLPINQCVTLLLNECDNLLNQPKPSEIIKSKTMPSLSFIGIVFSMFFSTYAHKDQVVLNNDAMLPPLGQITSTFSHFFSDGFDLLPSFLILTMLMIVFYFFFVFIFIPYHCSPLLDYDWITALELKDTLSYIKEKNYYNDITYFDLDANTTFTPTSEPPSKKTYKADATISSATKPQIFKIF